MKYTISQQRLNDFKISYLDNISQNPAMLDNFIVISRQDEGEDIEQDVIMEYDYEDGRLYVENSFFRRYHDMFFPNENYWDVANFILTWFEKKFGVDVEYVDYK